MSASARSRDPALSRVLEAVESLGLERHLLELETQGYTVLRGALTAETVARAKAAILRRVEHRLGHPVDPDSLSANEFNGMQYVPYLLYDDEVFEEILLTPAPLALVTYLLGESCLLSSLGCHFRGPGGLPLMVHSDNGNGMPPPFSPIAMVANVNYALTPYSREAGALAMIPGSHRLLRQPTPHENFRPADQTFAEVSELAKQPGGADPVVWRDPPGAVAMEIAPGDAVIWHGNTWHGGFRREIPGARINLSAYFCRQHVQTQERHGDPAHKAVLARRSNQPRFATLLGAKVPYGWREEGPDYGLMARNPRGQYD